MENIKMKLVEKTDTGKFIIEVERIVTSYIEVKQITSYIEVKQITSPLIKVDNSGFEDGIWTGKRIDKDSDPFNLNNPEFWDNVTELLPAII